MNWLALDIGGANLKAADGRGYAASHHFALWKDSKRLAAKLRRLIAEAPPADHLAVTMTGELADCFSSKKAGVLFILKAVEQAADGRHTRIYLNDGRLVAPPVVVAQPLAAASSNWHALASYCTRLVKTGVALLIDIGSTTTDIVPLCDGQVQCVGHTDSDRLLAGELVYSGIERSPVCALVRTLTYRGWHCPIAQEVFATTRDAYLLLDDLLEAPEDRHTADGQPATKQAAALRMARMISADDDQYDMDDVMRWATEVTQAQRELIVKAISGVLNRIGQPLTTVILSGHGEFLGRRIAAQLECQKPFISLSEQLGPDASRCAPAHALAALARQPV